MGQFSVEICHLVGQFSMKLNTLAHRRQPAGRFLPVRCRSACHKKPTFEIRRGLAGTGTSAVAMSNRNKPTCSWKLSKIIARLGRLLSRRRAPHDTQDGCGNDALPLIERLDRGGWGYHRFGSVGRH